MESRLSLAASISVAALASLGTLGGWIIVLMGGFHSGRKYTKSTIFVEGLPAMVMACLMFLTAAIGVVALCRSAKIGIPWQVAACGVILLPPLMYHIVW